MKIVIFSPVNAWDPILWSSPLLRFPLSTQLNLWPCVKLIRNYCEQYYMEMRQIDYNGSLKKNPPTFQVTHNDFKMIL